MKFNCDANILKNLFQTCAGYTSKDKNSILNNYLFSAQNGVLSLTAANEVVQITATASIESDNAFSFLAPQSLFERIKVLSGSVEFDLDGLLLTINNGSYKTTAKLFSSENYPLQTLDDFEELGLLTFIDLTELTKVAMACSASDDTLRELRGVYVGVENGFIDFVATNRLRLYWIQRPTQIQPFNVIAEREVIVALSKLNKNSQTIKLFSDKERTRIAFCTDNITIIGKTISGTYPKYSAVTIHHLPNVKTIDIDTLALKEALLKVSAISDEEVKPVDFSINSDQLGLVCTNKEGEQASDYIPIKQSFNTNETIKIHGKYLLEFLNSTPPANITFYFTAADRPVELKVDQRTYLMTPLK